MTVILFLHWFGSSELWLISWHNILLSRSLTFFLKCCFSIWRSLMIICFNFYSSFCNPPICETVAFSKQVIRLVVPEMPETSSFASVGLFCSTGVRSNRPEVFFKKGALRNFEKFTGRHLCLQLYYKRDFGTGGFLWILRNF